MIINKDSFEEQLSIFIVNHYKNCQLVECSCRKIFEGLGNLKAAQEKNKSKQIQLNIKQSQKLQTMNHQTI